MKRLLLILALALPLVLPAQDFKVIDVNARHRLFKGVNHKLFNAALNGDVPAFNGVMNPISPSEIKEIGRRKTIVPIYPDPDDPYYFYDSLVVEEFAPENIDGYIFMIDTAAASDTTALDTPKTIGIYYNIVERGNDGQKVKLRQDLFWVKWEDAMPLLTMAERKYLINLYELQEGVER